MGRPSFSGSKMKVYLLEHLMIYPEDNYEDTKFIGVFSSQESAKKAIAELIQQPGFRSAPQIIDPLQDDTSGFILEEWTVDKVTWNEGFGRDDEQ